MRIVRPALLLAYPLSIYAALRSTTPRVASLGLLAVLALRLATDRRGAAMVRAAAPPGIVLGGVLGATALWNHPVALLAAPALGSFALLVVFARSLAGEESFVESLARAQLGVLSSEEASYCRRVTGVWCVFLFANGAIALYLACFGALASWALYTGVIAYVAMAALFSAEFVYRQWRFRRYVGAPSDFLFRRIFPPHVE